MNMKLDAYMIGPVIGVTTREEAWDYIVAEGAKRNYRLVEGSLRVNMREDPTNRDFRQPMMYLRALIDNDA